MISNIKIQGSKTISFISICGDLWLLSWGLIFQSRVNITPNIFWSDPIHKVQFAQKEFFQLYIAMHCRFSKTTLCVWCGVDNRNITLNLLHSYICNRVDTILGLDITSIYIYNVLAFDLWCELLPLSAILYLHFKMVSIVLEFVQLITSGEEKSVL